MSNVVLRLADVVVCRICGRWAARDWWIEDGWPHAKMVHVARVCVACKATQTECLQCP